jgi:hypothetical protein
MEAELVARELEYHRLLSSLQDEQLQCCQTHLLTSVCTRQELAELRGMGGPRWLLTFHT